MDGISNVDKLLICLAIILLLTIVWTILIGIIYKMREGSRKTSKISKSKLVLEDDDDDDYEEEIVVTKSAKKATKTKKAKKSKTKSARKSTAVVRAKSNQETYVKVKFYRTKKNLIYVAPENVVLRKGEKVKVRTEDGSIRTAVVTQGNYTRDKYKTYEYQVLDLIA